MACGVTRDSDGLPRKRGALVGYALDRPEIRIQRQRG